MKYDAYFHNDFDGRASAAVMLAFLRSRGDDIGHYVPIDFHLEEQWLQEKFFEKHKLFKGKRNPAAAFDFLYHPGAAFWFDHHPTTFRKKGWRKRFKPDKYHVLDSGYPSCCHLVYTSLRKNFGWKPPRHIAELVKWLDVVDSARYKSARQTLDFKEPALQIDAFIDASRNDSKTAAWMVKMLAEKPLSEIARLPKVNRVVKRLRKESALALAFYRKNLVISGNSTFIDIIDSPVRMLRHASYYLYPKAKYAVRLAMKGHKYHVGVGLNPWIDIKHSVHIGELLRHYGGGGHKGAGAVDFLKRTDAERAIPEILAFLNRKSS